MPVRKAARHSVAGLIVAGLVLTSGVGKVQAQPATPTEVCTLHFSGGVRIDDVPVARSREQQARGLMHRNDVGPGMLFSWPDAAPRAFWMHNTPTALSIGFFDATGRLFVIKDMQPESDFSHFSDGAAQDALELAQGGFAANGLSVGAQLLQRYCRVR